MRTITKYQKIALLETIAFTRVDLCCVYNFNMFPFEFSSSSLRQITTTANGSIPPQVLSVLNNEHLTKDGLALEFLLEVFVTYKQEKGGNAPLVAALRKSGLDNRLLEFLPLNKRNEDYLKTVLVEKDLADIFKLHMNQASQEAKRELTQVRKQCIGRVRSR